MSIHRISLGLSDDEYAVLGGGATMTEKTSSRSLKSFIGRTEYNAEDLKKLGEDHFVHRDQVQVTAVDGLTYVFHGLISMDYNEWEKREVNHYAAVGPGGALQIICLKRQTWPGGRGPLDIDPEVNDERHKQLSKNVSIARVFSPSYWTEVTALDWMAWTDEERTSDYYSRNSP